ncbi:MAG: hypothetical protein LKK00_01685 [Intestinimonas sp.]|jgi:predicted transcriptional regulator|nr:hypothetical protein [Intestinimonas sp.]
MKAVLMSMKPQWWEKILSGEKTLEIRKTAPVDGFSGENTWRSLLVLVYVSGTGEIQGQFFCHGWMKAGDYAYLSKRSCVPPEALVNYAAGKRLCAWMVREPKKYDTPRQLAELGLTRPPMSWRYVELPDSAEVE